MISVDLFAGGGGASTGIEQATGVPVAVAVDHCPVAIAMHRANHPTTEHHLSDVWEINPRDAVQGRGVGLAWLSPECPHFSRAPGCIPLSRRRRGLAWLAVWWAKTVRPRIMIVENVPEFVTWGPLKNSRPDQAREGLYFRQWVRELTLAGYAVEWRVLSAADYGAATTRTRLFMVARCDGRPIQWPAPTGAIIPASTIIDWTLPMGPADSLAQNTQDRINRGRALWGDQFILKFYGRGWYQSLASPLHTVMGRNHFGLVEVVNGRSFLRMLQPRELYRAHGFPDDYEIWPTVNGQTISRAMAVEKVGNSVVVPMARRLVEAVLLGRGVENPGQMSLPGIG